MLEIIGVIVLSILAVIMAAVGVGAASGEGRKSKENKTANEVIGKLKSYGMNPHASSKDLEVDNAMKMKGNGVVGGGFGVMTGRITRHEHPYSGRNHTRTYIHEGFHRAHYISLTSPTKKLRGELNAKWHTSRENIRKVKGLVSQLPQNLIRGELGRKAESGDVSSAILYNTPEDTVLNEFKYLSDRYEQELEAFLRSEENSRLEGAFDNADASFRAFTSNAIYNFLYSESGIQKMTEVCLKYLSAPSDKEKMPPQLKNSVRKMFREQLVNFTYAPDISDKDGVIDAFKAFLNEQNLSELEEERARFHDSFDKWLTPRKSIENKHGGYLREYFENIKSDYLDMVDKTPPGPKNPFNRRESEPRDWIPLTEAFAYYLNVQRGEEIKEKVRTKLLEDYPKNNEDFIKYESAFRHIFKIHEKLKMYGNLSDEEALKLVLPMSKYIRYVDELEKFAGDEKNLKELIEYSKIASNNGTDAFGEYRGLTALKHFRNKGK